MAVLYSHTHCGLSGLGWPVKGSLVQITTGQSALKSKPFMPGDFDSEIQIMKACATGKKMSQGNKTSFLRYSYIWRCPGGGRASIH